MRVVFATLLVLSLLGCNETKEKEGNPSHKQSDELPYLGPKDIDSNGDTIYHTVPDFGFLNQDSVLITNEDVKDKIYVASFFFTSCPNICPKITNQIKRLQAMVKDIDEIQFLSHTVDPKRDTIAKLKAYIEKYQIDTKNWHLLRGSKDYTYEMAKEGYKATAAQDAAAEGGFIHSQYLILVDRDGHIRAVHDGTITEEVDQLEEDIRKLLASYGND